MKDTNINIFFFFYTDSNSQCLCLHFLQFRYLGSVIAANGGVEADVCHRVNGGCKVLGALEGEMKNRGLAMNVEKVVVLTVMYCSES